MAYTPQEQPLAVTWQGTEAYTPPALPLAVGWVAVVGEGSLSVSWVGTPLYTAPSLPLEATWDTGDYVSGALAVTLGPPAIPAPTVAIAATQLFDLPDRDGPGARLRQQHGAPRGAGVRIVEQQGTPIQRAAAERHQHGAPRQAGFRAPHQHGLPIRRWVAERTQHGLRIQAGAGVRQQHGRAIRRGVAERYQHGLPLGTGAGVRHAEYLRTRTTRTLREQHGRPFAIRLTLGHHQARIAATALRVRWQHTEWPKPGRWWPFYEPPPLSQLIVLACPYTPRPLRCTVLLHWYPIHQPYCAGLDPGEELPASIYVPIREVYIVINTFSLIRVSDSTELEALDFDASLAADSFAWTFSTTLPGSHLSLIRPAPGAPPVELLATLNGTAIRLIAEKFNRDRVFGKSVIRVSGRGRAAWLADPFSPIETRRNAETRTAQQLIDDALKINGVPIGWSVDWRLEDWSVPAGEWSQTGTYLSAVQRIAEAGGGYVQGHHTAQTLILRPWYPLPPWQWAGASPDVALPDAACITEGIEWLEKPGYNAVWVVGGAGGRRDKVKITGSAGDYHAPTIIDPLATATEMTRQRGLRALADTGRQALIDVSLPLLPETGILHPGLLVDYTENAVTRRGYTRSVSIRYQFPIAAQTVRIETHEPVS